MAKKPEKAKAPSPDRDEKGRFIKKPSTGRPFRAEDGSASEAGKKSGEARRRKADLRELCRVWMEEIVGTGKDGQPITGGEMMVRVAAKELAKGNSKFWELMRDTAGFKPVDKVMVADVDPGVIEEVEAAVKEAASDG